MLIGQLATATGVTTKTLRYYESEGLLHPPARTPGGYRDYPGEAVDRVVFMREAQRAGLTLRQIREVLAVRDGGDAPCAHVAAVVDARLADVERHLRELRRTRARLVALRRRLDGLDPADCASDDICSAVGRVALTDGPRP